MRQCNIITFAFTDGRGTLLRSTLPIDTLLCQDMIPKMLGKREVMIKERRVTLWLPTGDDVLTAIYIRRPRGRKWTRKRIASALVKALQPFRSKSMGDIMGLERTRMGDWRVLIELKQPVLHYDPRTMHPAALLPYDVQQTNSAIILG